MQFLWFLCVLKYRIKTHLKNQMHFTMHNCAQFFKHFTCKNCGANTAMPNYDNLLWNSCGFLNVFFLHFKTQKPHANCKKNTVSCLTRELSIETKERNIKSLQDGNSTQSEAKDVGCQRSCLTIFFFFFLNRPQLY